MAETAPAVATAATATATATAALATAVKPGPGFDAVLMLQALAGAAANLNAESLEAGDAADLPGAEGDEDEDEEAGEELESSLAFLAALIRASSPRNPGDFTAGGQSSGNGASNEENTLLPLQQFAGEAESLVAANSLPKPEKPEAVVNLIAAAPETPDSLEPRAAELLQPVQRPAQGATTTATVMTPARDPRWADDLGARVTTLVRAGESTAILQLTPVDLGPVEVNVTVKDNQATIHFGASQAETRALLEASLPRLRELLAAQGFSLTDASVSSGFSRSPQPDNSPGPHSADEPDSATTESRARRQLGLLDLYA